MQHRLTRLFPRAGKRTALFVTALALGATACQEQVTEPEALRVTDAPAMSVAQEPVLDRGAAALPAGASISDRGFFDLFDRAINPDDYVCTQTAVVDWYIDTLYDIIDEDPQYYLTMYNLAADLVVTYDALYYQSADTSRYFGYAGEYTEVIEKSERDIKRFWDIQSADIQVVALHGDMLLDTARVARVYRTVFGIPSPWDNLYATDVRDVLLESTTLNGGNHPFFSFNAFAFSDYGGPFADKIAMGDGMLAGYQALGFGDVAPQAIFAHEFAHHIQYERGYFNDPQRQAMTPPERTRYTELMADAMAAYWLTHARGATMRQDRVEQFLQAFYEIGDCGYTSSNHHGTPNQRMRAARFGFDLADQAQKQGHIMTADQFHALFVAEYDRLVAPDA